PCRLSTRRDDELRRAFAKLRRLTVRSAEDPRGARRLGADVALQTCIRQVGGVLTMMQSCASAAKLRAAGPIFSSASVPVRITASRHLGSSIRQCAEKPARAE